MRSSWCPNPLNRYNCCPWPRLLKTDRTGGGSDKKRSKKWREVWREKYRRSPKQAVGIRSFPEAVWVWGYGGGGQPHHPERREIGQQGREVRTQSPSELGAGLQTRRSLKSNGWADETAALQIFAHLEGEALNVALLMPEGERANREWLSQGLSNYYYSSGRLAVFRRKFESVTRRTGADPATFTTELEILAVRGFGDMGTCARNRMVRDRFIADQRSCGLRRHLDSIPSYTLIREIVDRCRVWESHSEQKRGSSPGTDLDRGHSGVSGALRRSQGFRYPWLV